MVIRLKSFDWDDENTNPISRHNVAPDEAEEVIADEAARSLRSHSGRLIALGQTEAGRYLTVVYEPKNGVIRVVTALSSHERKKPKTLPP